MSRAGDPRHMTARTFRYRSRALAWLLVAILGVTAAVAVLVSAAGDLDPTFEEDGKVLTDFGGSQDRINAIAIQSDGKIVAVGRRNPGTPVLVRYNADGSLDGDFGLLGTVATEVGDAIVLQADGKIVVAGSTTTGFLLVRYASNGFLDSTFGSSGNGRVTTNFSLGTFDFFSGLASVAVHPTDGRIVAIGSIHNFSGPDVWVLARYDPSGLLDNTFDGDGKVVTSFAGTAQARDVAVHSDGKIVAAGMNDATGFDVNAVLVRYTSTGQLDSSFGGGHVFPDFGGDDVTSVVAIQDDGKIVIGGGIPGSNGSDFVIARYSDDGSLDLSLQGVGYVLTDFGGSEKVTALALQPAAGKIVAAGFTSPGFRERFAVARYDAADGSLDTTFGAGGITLADFHVEGVNDWIAIPEDVAIDGDGNIVAAGTGWTGIGGDTDFGLMRFLGAGNTPAGTNVSVQLENVDLTFQNVVQPGDTTVTTSSTGPTPPEEFGLGNPRTYFDITTTAVFTGSVGVCISYLGVAYDNEATLALMHYDGTLWVDVTTTLDTLNDIICGSVTSLSPFIVVERLDVNDPPVADAGPDQTVSAGADCQAQVTLNGTGSSDPDGDALTYAWTGSFGATTGPTPTLTLPLGAHTITLTVTDTHGESASDTVVVTVVDTSAPAITTLTANPALLWPPKHQMVRVSVTALATDNCGGAVTCAIVSVASDEPIQGLGDGDTAPDWEITGPLTLRLRAERDATGDARIYTVTVQCTDVAGNVSTATVTVFVPRAL